MDVGRSKSRRLSGGVEGLRCQILRAGQMAWGTRDQKLVGLKRVKRVKRVKRWRALIGCC